MRLPWGMNAFLEIDFLQNSASSGEVEAAHEAVERHHEIESQSELLGACVRQLLDGLRLAFELLRAKKTREEMEKDFAPFANDVSEIHEDDEGDTHCLPLDVAGRYLGMLESLFPTRPISQDEYRIEILERILKNTPKILKDRGVTPAKEVTVYKAVGEVLVHVFPDFTLKVNLAKPLKTYKPDFGFPEAGIAVEHKFASTIDEVKAALDGIFSDMQGYASPEWKTFYAVIYMTDHFYTQEQIESHTRLAECRRNWRILPVYGKGQRKKKDKAAGERA